MTYVISKFQYISGWRIRVQELLGETSFNGKIYNSAEEALVDLAHITQAQKSKIIIRSH